jgi:hypothetical protein
MNCLQSYLGKLVVDEVYFELWNHMMIQLNIEYHSNHFTHLHWTVRITQNNNPNTTIAIFNHRYLVKHRGQQTHKYHIIDTRNNQIIMPVSKNYWYSSGMNHYGGYKHPSNHSS